jgi:hypothetical protein
MQNPKESSMRQSLWGVSFIALIYRRHKNILKLYYYYYYYYFHSKLPILIFIFLRSQRLSHIAFYNKNSSDTEIQKKFIMKITRFKREIVNVIPTVLMN